MGPSSGGFGGKRRLSRTEAKPLATSAQNAPNVIKNHRFAPSKALSALLLRLKNTLLSRIPRRIPGKLRKAGVA
jgi:hypothetical protein